VTDEDAFLDAILEHHEDDAPRLVYAEGRRECGPWLPPRPRRG
jgi:hypothetical protein